MRDQRLEQVVGTLLRAGVAAAAAIVLAGGIWYAGGFRRIGGQLSPVSAHGAQPSRAPRAARAPGLDPGRPAHPHSHAGGARRAVAGCVCHGARPHLRHLHHHKIFMDRVLCILLRIIVI